MKKKVLVVKLGTAVLTGSNGNIDKQVISKIAAQIARLREQYDVALVSSGAVGSGKKLLGEYRGTVRERKAAAAIGNPLLINIYHQYFSKHGITVAQALCERVHFSRRQQFLQLKETFSTLWQHGVVPIINENDLVSNVEIKFSDNDELATLIAIGFDAASMILCTSAGGLLDDKGNIIPRVSKIDNTILSYVSTEKSGPGLGGMISKLTFTRLATTLGINVIICGLKGKDPLMNALDGNNGTYFAARPSTLRSRQKWLASGSVTFGTLHVDKGAARALLQRKSLLTVGISRAEGKFAGNEVVQLMDEDGNIIGVAKTKLAATTINRQLTIKNVVAAHADDIVLFE